MKRTEDDGEKRMRGCSKDMKKVEGSYEKQTVGHKIFLQNIYNHIHKGQCSFVYRFINIFKWGSQF